MTTSFARRPILLAIFVLLVGLLPHGYAATNAKRVNSEYLHTDSGSFWWKPDGTWRFELHVSSIKAAPSGGPLYLLASFQNPQGGKPLINSGIVPSGTQQKVILNSTPISGMRNGRKYLVTVHVFADKAHTKLLGTHKQLIVYHQLPAEVFRQYLRDHR